MKPTARCPDCMALVVACVSDDGPILVDPEPDRDRGTVISAGLPRVIVLESPGDAARSEAFVYSKHYCQ